MKVIIALGAAAMLYGCAGANISSQVRESPANSTSANMKLRCLDFNTGSSKSINAQLKQYDGWKMVYVSEYTTGNKTATDAVVCFEKPNS
jgi:hypothetical protein